MESVSVAEVVLLNPDNQDSLANPENQALEDRVALNPGNLDSLGMVNRPAEAPNLPALYHPDQNAVPELIRSALLLEIASSETLVVLSKCLLAAPSA